MKNYTQEWNGNMKLNVSNLGKFDLCLEIGCFEGRTSNFIVENLLSENGTLLCVDPLLDKYVSDDSELNSTESFFEGQYEKFINNTKDYLGHKIKLYRDISSNALKELKKKFSGKISFIYVDGDHRPESVYLDGLDSFDLCSIGGYILFDDYKWKDTHIGIDKFLSEKNGQYEEVIRNEQIMIKKL